MLKPMIVVDDSATMRKIIIKTLRQTELHVPEEIEEASNGKEALDLMKMHLYSVVLCDVNMPEMSGDEFVREARKLPEHKNTLIIMISTESSEAFIREMKEIGADGYLTKPFTPEKLQGAIGPLLAGVA